MINFWNGNKSNARRKYESELFIKLVSRHTKGQIFVHVDDIDYPSSDEESRVFQFGFDALVTVVENKKFAETPVIEIPIPICKGLLGKRILMIRKEDKNKFHHISQRSLKELVSGIPATWADAELFRHNGYKVLEYGSMNDIIVSLQQYKCDYVSLGASEIGELFDSLNPSIYKDLMIEETNLICYPMPLVFYVNPNNTLLASLLKKNLDEMRQNDKFDNIFDRHFKCELDKLNIEKRTVINMINPNITKNTYNL